MRIYASQHDLVGGVFQLLEGRALERGCQIGVRYGEALTRSAYRPRAIHQVTGLFDRI